MENNDIEFKYMRLEQPAGLLHLGSLKVNDILNISKIDRLIDGGIQRFASSERVKKITKYAKTEDAIFPTPIIITGKSENVRTDGDSIFFKTDYTNDQKFSVIDGQHRLLGISDANLEQDIEVPLVVIFDTEPFEDAAIFVTINGNQVKVPSNIIYQLFDIMPGRSVEKTCHNIAQLLNTEKESPFYNRLKMLGVKMDNQDFAPLTQSSFITPIIDLLESDRLFFELYQKELDDYIYELIFNFFTAVSRVFKSDWESEFSMLPKAIGHKSLILLLERNLIKQQILSVRDVTNYNQEYFEKHLNKIHDGLEQDRRKPENQKIIEENYVEAIKSVLSENIKDERRERKMDRLEKEYEAEKEILISNKQYGSSYGDANRLYHHFVKFLKIDSK